MHDPEWLQTEIRRLTRALVRERDPERAEHMSESLAFLLSEYKWLRWQGGFGERPRPSRRRR